MSRSYRRYCPVSHALDLIGERWALLIAHELMEGPLRFTDLEDHLDGIGTNILSARLKSLEQCGVLRKRKLPPPAASTVYELTDYGRAVEPVIRELAWWGVRTMGPPDEDEELHPGWLAHALRVGLEQNVADVPETVVEFRSGEEVATVSVGGGTFAVEPAPASQPDAVVEGTVREYWALFIERDFGAVKVDGDEDSVDRLLRTVPAVEPVAAA